MNVEIEMIGLICFGCAVLGAIQTAVFHEQDLYSEFAISKKLFARWDAPNKTEHPMRMSMRLAHRRIAMLLFYITPLLPILVVAHYKYTQQLKKYEEDRYGKAK